MGCVWMGWQEVRVGVGMGGSGLSEPRLLKDQLYKNIFYCHGPSSFTMSNCVKCVSLCIQPWGSSLDDCGTLPSHRTQYSRVHYFLVIIVEVISDLIFLCIDLSLPFKPQGK